MSLKRRLSTPEGKKAYVRSLFATIADRYDLITVVLSYGLDWRWKLRLVDLVHPDANARSLDLATGTGDIAFLLRRGCAHVIGLDVTQRMVELARAKGSGASSPAFLVGDMMTLPFADAQFDTVVSTLVLCTVSDQARALRELRRVLKPGGRLLFIEHVRSEEPRLASWQDRLNGLNRVVAHGCNCNRSTLDTIRAAGFTITSLERDQLHKAPPFVRPLVVGTAALNTAR